MDYEQSRIIFEKACEEVLVGFVRADYDRNDIWKATGPIAIDRVKAIMDEADLVFQPGFENFRVIDNCVFVQPRDFGDCTWHWGMAIDLVDGHIYMNHY